MCWIPAIILCPTNATLDYSGNWLLHQGKLMFSQFHIYILKNKVTGLVYQQILLKVGKLLRNRKAEHAHGFCSD